jgi:hypothetical protein
VVGNSPIDTYNKTVDNGIIVPLTSTMRDYANVAGFQTLQGRYDFTVTCRTAFDETSLEDFKAPIWFTSNTKYQDTDPASPTTSPTTTTSSSATPSNTNSPTDTESPTDDPTPTDTTLPTDTAAPTDTSTGDGSQDISTNVNGGASGGSGNGGSLAATGVNAGVLGTLSAALVLAGVVVVRRARAREDFPATDTSNT